jgi:hypothetical protein
LCVEPDTVPAQSFCAEISFSSQSHFVVLVGVAILRSKAFPARALIYTERKEHYEF